MLTASDKLWYIIINKILCYYNKCTSSNLYHGGISYTFLSFIPKYQKVSGSYSFYNDMICDFTVGLFIIDLQCFPSVKLTLFVL